METNKYQIPDTKRNERIIKLRKKHGKKMSFNEIGREMGITGERARQIYHKYK